MAFTEKERTQWEPIVTAFIERRRPPEHLRSQVDLKYTFDDQSIIIFEERQHWQEPEKKHTEQSSQNNLGPPPAGVENILAAT